MKIAIRLVLMIVLIAGFFAAGFAAGVPFGRSSGFTLGTEWAMVQAELLAREEGVFMPIRYEEGQFRIILKQPRHLYRRAWKLADRYEEEMTRADQDGNNLSSGTELARNITIAEEPVAVAPEKEAIASPVPVSLGAPLGIHTAEQNAAGKDKDITL
jgi:hypothetical protein